MLTARSILVAAFVVAILSLAMTIVNLAGPPDNDGWGRDSYGTRALGVKAVHDLLRELRVPVERGLAPPVTALRRNVCLAFLSPHPTLVALEPEYLRRVGEWVREGGVVVIAPASSTTLLGGFVPPDDGEEETSAPLSALALLGLPDVAMTTSSAPGAAGEAVAPSVERETFPWQPRRIATPQLRDVAVAAEGELARLDPLVRTLHVPQRDLQTIATPSTLAPVGRLYRRGEDGGQTLVALYAAGRGRIAVVSDPAILFNYALGKGDNAVLAAHLLAGFGRPVVLDEFYHGLTIRGNPIWLATRHPYGLTAAMIVLATLIWVWRGMVHLGPPLPERLTRRRTLREYVEAMASLFQRARHRDFVLKELRDGVLWSLGKRLHVAPGHETPDEIARRLQRKSPDEAARLLRVAGAVDGLLRRPRQPDKRELIQSAKDLTQCL